MIVLLGCDDACQMSLGCFGCGTCHSQVEVTSDDAYGMVDCGVRVREKPAVVFVTSRQVMVIFDAVFEVVSRREKVTFVAVFAQVMEIYNAVFEVVNYTEMVTFVAVYVMNDNEVMVTFAVVFVTGVMVMTYDIEEERVGVGDNHDYAQEREKYDV